ncbi:universal stress protein [Mycolicibacterium litorale]|uniref:Universal stress protein n=1 Tax=Mycolicibacterium litorale TaxID=758802 RepID=A0AAD1MSC1_9MYCO|nr:universal stress protein [Mycolicibacterium litorale]MCV7413867.1 universal stress protein [Mycolicibacterium litorale]TDY03249.1 nucleotide-binding universal stress UspA family protein [Mycolicibacterium litorale]BBY15043.1 universal stress protein [Mycolicibacterium litorale]
MSSALRPGIVVAVDGSASSDAALRWSAREAVLHRIPLLLVHVLSTDVTAAWATAVPAALLPLEYFQGREEQARGVLAEAEALVKDAGATLVTTKFVHAAPVPALVEASTEAEMVVAGTRGNGAVKRLLLGSVSTGLLYHARCPVAVVGADTVLDRPDAPVVVGVDGSRASEQALGIAFDEASLRGVDLVALHSWSDRSESLHPYVNWEGVRAQAEETLAISLAGFGERYPDVTVHREVVFDRPAEHLLERSESAQLLVVGSRGRGGFAGMLLGSVSAAVVQAAGAPVIVARGR